MHSISLLRIIHLANPDMYSDKIFSPALRIIGNLATGSANLCKALLDAGCIDLLKKLIWHPVEIVRKEALWALRLLLLFFSLYAFCISLLFFYICLILSYFPSYLLFLFAYF